MPCKKYLFQGGDAAVGLDGGDVAVVEVVHRADVNPQGVGQVGPATTLCKNRVQAVLIKGAQ